MGVGAGPMVRTRRRLRRRGVCTAVAVAVAVAGSLSAVPDTAGAGGEVEAPTITEYAPARVVSRYERFEAGATVTPVAVNPFDPAQIRVRARFVAPDGSRATAEAYWFQDYGRALVAGREVLTPRGDPHWKVRFAPPTPGRWRWRWDVVTPAGHRRGVWHALRVRTRTANSGFLRVSTVDSRYVVHDDGTPYFAIGENLGWYDGRGTYAYDDWLAELESQGANWVRIWMPSWAMGIEWSDTGLGDYTRRLDRAWQLDYVLDAAARRGIAVQLVLQNHGAFSTIFNSEWAQNPYNAANGGPIATPGEFFTNPAALDLFRRRVRYVVARYHANTNLLAWELWNEADLTDGYDSASVARWHRDLANYIRALDPARHLVTTSFAFHANDPVVWSESTLDLTQTHHYSMLPGLTWFPDIARDVVDWSAERVADYDRPTLFSELGVNSVGGPETVAADPKGIGVHDGLWAGAFGQAMGTAMPWWWDSVTAADPWRYYPMFGAISGFVQGVAWDREGFAASEPAITGGSGRPVRAHLLAGPRLALLWVKDGGYQWNTPTKVPITDAEIALDDLAPGRWCAGWWNTWSGGWVGIGSFEAGPARTLSMPAFERDTAVRMARC